MSIFKVLKDQIHKALLGKNSVPRELFDLAQYFVLHGPIHFEFKQEGDVIVAVSTNYRLGSIVTSGKTREELDQNIRDAILTSFDVPSAYAPEANVHAVGDAGAHAYALAK